MKILLIVITLLLSLTSSYATDIKDYINKNNCDQIIDKQVYTVCYDYKMKGAKYVAYQLNGSKVGKNIVSKHLPFYSEKTIKNKYRSKNKDYWKSGYDRGHLASHASFNYDKKIVKKTYSLVNIIPQSPKVNRGVWKKVERYERQVAVKLGSVGVINKVIYSSNPKRIGKNEIAVPSALIKMIYNDEAGFKKCYYFINDLTVKPNDNKLRSHLVNCNKFNRL